MILNECLNELYNLILLPDYGKLYSVLVCSMSIAMNSISNKIYTIIMKNNGNVMIIEFSAPKNPLFSG